MQNRVVYIALIASFLFFLATGNTFAQEYVLPYPGFMPGNPLYQVSSLLDKIEEWWSFGNLAQYRYHLKSADKELVEAKTLFEYKQYFFAFNALQESDISFEKAKLSLSRAKMDGKDIRKKENELKQASRKHQEVLKNLLDVLPSEFLWQPEFSKPTNLKIKEAIENSIRKR